MRPLAKVKRQRLKGSADLALDMEEVCRIDTILSISYYVCNGTIRLCVRMVMENGGGMSDISKRLGGNKLGAHLRMSVEGFASGLFEIRKVKPRTLGT